MLHRQRGEGEHRSKIRKWTLLFVASILCAFFIVAMASASAAYGLGQQPKSQAQELSQASQKSVRQGGLSAQDRTIFAYSDSITNELRALLAPHAGTHPELVAKLDSLIRESNNVAKLYAEAVRLEELYAQQQVELELRQQEYADNQNSLSVMSQIYSISQSNTSAAREIQDAAHLLHNEASLLFSQIQQELDLALYNYDTYLIPDPNYEQVEAQPGLRADIYVIDFQSPIRADNAYQHCKTIIVSNIDFNFGEGDIYGCGAERVMIHYTGFLTVPESTPYGYDFLSLSDDGWFLSLDGVTVNDNWVLKGCGGWWSEKFHLVPNDSYALDAWWYEWSGGACSTLYYDNGYNWGVVPPAWFTQTEVVTVPLINDPALFAIVVQKQQELEAQRLGLDSATSELDLAELEYERLSQQESVAEENLLAQELVTAQSQSVLVAQQVATEAALIEYGSASALYVTRVDSLESGVELLRQEILAIPAPIPTPTPNPEPTPTPAPAPTLTPEPFPTVEPEPIAVVLLFEAVGELFDAIANVGADMSPEVREQAEKVVVSAIVVTQVATQAAQIATQAAAASASAAASSSSSAGRRK